MGRCYRATRAICTLYYVPWYWLDSGDRSSLLFQIFASDTGLEVDVCQDRSSSPGTAQPTTEEHNFAWGFHISREALHCYNARSSSHETPCDSSWCYCSEIYQLSTAAPAAHIGEETMSQVHQDNQLQRIKLTPLSRIPNS